LLQKRYASLGSASRQDGDHFSRSIRGRLDILRVIHEWLNSGGGAQDALDDGSLFTAMRSFLSSPTDEVGSSQSELNEATLQRLDSLSQTRSRVFDTFLAQTRRPYSIAHNPRAKTAGVHMHPVRDYGRDVPNLENLDAEVLVGNLDAMASAAFRIVSVEVSWYICALHFLEC
jgi:GTPase-activating protein BEM2